MYSVLRTYPFKKSATVRVIFATVDVAFQRFGFFSEFVRPKFRN